MVFIGQAYAKWNKPFFIFELGQAALVDGLGFSSRAQNAKGPPLLSIRYEVLRAEKRLGERQRNCFEVIDAMLGWAVGAFGTASLTALDLAMPVRRMRSSKGNTLFRFCIVNKQLKSAIGNICVQ